MDLDGMRLSEVSSQREKVWHKILLYVGYKEP